MKNMKGLKGLAVFVICLWGIVLATYATQGRTGAEKGKMPITMQGPTCSSSSSGGSSSGGE